MDCRTHGDCRTAQFTWMDNKLDAGSNYYYVRVLQRDGQIAWSSPIWVNYKPRQCHTVGQLFREDSVFATIAQVTGGVMRCRLRSRK